MKRVTLFQIVLFATLVFLSACAPNANTVVNTVAEGASSPAGFWLGLWHGIIATGTLIVSLFTDRISVYEVHNNGSWYNFGFLLGFGAFASGSSSAAKQ